MKAAFLHLLRLINRNERHLLAANSNARFLETVMCVCDKIISMSSELASYTAMVDSIFLLIDTLN